MENLNDIKSIWLSAPTEVPSAADVLKKIKSSHRKHIIKSVALVAAALLLAITMTWVLITYEPKFITTRIGEAFMFVAIFIILGVGVTSVKNILAVKDYSNEAFLAYLKKLQQRQMAFQQRTQKIGFIIASTGLLLYIYEGLYESTYMLVAGYGLTLLFIWFCWFVMRPRSLQKKTKRLHASIAKFEKIAAQLQNNNHDL